MSLASYTPQEAIAQATWDQRRAADPQASAWVEASAGSGKTKVLTDRVLRLLLDVQEARGLALLLITHNLPVARHVADRIVLLEDGRCAAAPGSPAGPECAAPAARTRRS